VVKTIDMRLGNVKWRHFWPNIHHLLDELARPSSFVIDVTHHW